LARESSNVAGLKKLGVDISYGSLEDIQTLKNAMRGTEVVYHAAGEVFAEDPEKYYKVNVDGLANLVKAAGLASVKKIVHFSSSSATGPNPVRDIPVNEDSPCRPITPYGRSKLQGEQTLVSLANKYNVPVVIIRPPLVYGPGVSSSSRVLMFLKLIHKGMFRIIGHGNNLVSLCYIDNLVDGVLLAGTASKAIGQIYFLSDARPYTINEIAEAIAREEGKQIPLPHLPLWTAGVLSAALSIPARLFGFTSPLTRNTVRELKNSWYLDIAKARSELKYDPRIAFEYGLRKTVEWFLNDYLQAHSL
jgi:nucleoside-diphosphate-sugar epimerase